jgi:hypothetical protein
MGHTFIRILEIKILLRIIELTQPSLFVESTISLSQFYGIEIDDFSDMRPNKRNLLTLTNRISSYKSTFSIQT